MRVLEISRSIFQVQLCSQKIAPMNDSILQGSNLRPEKQSAAFGCCVTVGIQKRGNNLWNTTNHEVPKWDPPISSASPRRFAVSRSQFGQAKTSRRFFLRSSMTPCSSSVWITLPLSSRSKRTMSQRCSFSLRKRSQILLACILLRSKPEMSCGNAKQSLINRNPSRVLDIDCFIIAVSREDWIRNWELRLYKRGEGEGGGLDSLTAGSEATG